MEVLAGLALFVLGAGLLGEGAAALALPGRRLLLRAQGLKAGAAALLLGALTGSGTGLTLLGAGLYRLGLLPLAEAALMALGGTLGATLLALLAGLGGALASLCLALGLLLELLRLRPWARVGFGLGLTFLGVGLAGSGAKALAPLLQGLPSWGVFAGGLLLALPVGSANLFALLALALHHGGALGPGGAAALVLAGGVGATGPLFLLREAGASRLGLALLFHRLLLALPLLPFPFSPLALHVLYHALAFLLFPLLAPLWASLARRAFPERPLAPKYLERRALDDPALARALALRELARVGDAVVRLLRSSLEALEREAGEEKALEPLEDKVDLLVREILLYAADLAAREVEGRVLPLLQLAGELERLGDLSKRLLRKAERLWAQGLTFSEEGRKELLGLGRRLLARLERAVAALATGDAGLAQEVLEGEGLEAGLATLQQAHLERLKAGRRETQASTLTHLDLLLTLVELDRGIARLARLVLALEG